MSSILEALKKLEEEKAARRGGIGNIASRVASAGRRPRQGRTLVLPAAMAAVAVVAVIATYAVMGGVTGAYTYPSPAAAPACCSGAGNRGTAGSAPDPSLRRLRGNCRHNRAILFPDFLLLAPAVGFAAGRCADSHGPSGDGPERDRGENLLP